ncbi:MAG TPA: hypothetical protein VIZ28_18090 [Chitinophagaceae bacterium]
MKQLLFILTFLPAVTGTTQGVVNVNNVNPGTVTTTIRNTFNYLAGGSPVPATKYVQLVSGSPYFSDSWMNGKVVLSGGKICDSLVLRLDLLENEVQYLALDGAEMTASTPIRNITLTDSLAGKEYFFIHSSYMIPAAPAEAGWYQLLTTGNATLYKRTNKKMMESKAYASSITEQSILTTDQYFILTDATYTRVKKLKEIPDVLFRKANDLNKYISSKKLSGKSEQDFIDVVAEYNTLIQK